jgi:putative acetyltransferase
MAELVIALDRRQVDAARALFREYADALGFDLCFQGFENELASLPGEYAPPSGRLLLAIQDAKPVGCVALRELDTAICEMKRLYVRPGYRGRGIGRQLAKAAIEAAQESGYEKMRLDTVPWMTEAIRLYETLGFHDIPAYRPNPIPGARYLELRFDPAQSG